MFGCHERYQGKFTSHGKNHQKRVNLRGKEQVKVWGVTISMQFSGDHSDCIWMTVLFKVRWKHNWFRKNNKENWNTENTERWEETGGMPLSIFRPIHRHTSSFFLLEAYLYYPDSGLTWEDMNQCVPEHKMWEQRTVFTAKFTCVRAGTGTQA